VSLSSDFLVSKFALQISACTATEWLKPHATIICSGSDQPTKNEIPPAILAKVGPLSKVIEFSSPEA
jgi:ornithine cyclodeaminase/alanine dehydrogenase-like protein (mu-crystallin family)